MARSLRLEFPGAFYHVTSRGNERRTIFCDAADCATFLARLSQEIAGRRWRCHAYCLMSNHYHLLLETPEPNLSHGMRRLNSSYAQDFNRRYRRAGHLMQGRYHSIVVEKDAYLLELSRYIVLNPVRAGLVARVEEWPWSSYRSTAGLEATPAWLTTTELLARFDEGNEVEARHAYRRFVGEGLHRRPLREVRGGVWLGGPGFRRLMAERLAGRGERGVPLGQRDPRRPGLREILSRVLEAYGLQEDELLSGRCLVPLRASVYLMRRIGGVPVREVARATGIREARVWAIQKRIETNGPDATLRSLLAEYGRTGDELSEPPAGYSAEI